MTCRLRALWLISTLNNKCRVITSKKFPTVENRFTQLCAKENLEYTAIPKDEKFLGIFTNSLKDRNTNINRDLVPILHNSSNLKSCLWPLVYMKCDHEPNLVIIGLPILSVEKLKEVPNMDPLVILDFPEVSYTLNVLQSIGNFCKENFKDVSASDFSPLLLDQINYYISTSIVFGKMIYNDFGTNKLLREDLLTENNQTEVTRSTNKKLSSWKPFIQKQPKPKIQLTIVEEVQAVFYDKQNVNDFSYLSGFIECDAKLENAEIQIKLENPSDENSNKQVKDWEGRLGKYGKFKFHECVESTENNKIRLRPPNNKLTILRFSNAEPPKILPLRAFYQMKEMSPTQAKVLLQIKLHQSVSNSFEYCEVILPFFNRGPIITYEVAPTTGTVTIDNERKRLTWKIGTKITTRNLEVALPATVNFSPNDPNVKTPFKVNKKQNNEEKIISSSKNFFHDQLSDSFNPFIYGGFDDPFCVGQNCYALLRFKMMDFSLTGLTIDPKRQDSVTIDPKPTTKPQISIERYVFSEKYIIWNSLGETKNTKI